MSEFQPTFGSKLVRWIQKGLVSIFVVCSFLAYAVQQRFAATDAVKASPTPSDDPSASVQADLQPAAAPTAEPLTPAEQPPLAAQPTAARPTATLLARALPKPTATPAATATTAAAGGAKSSGAYKDGSYTGSRVNAYWGWVQVKAVVQNGKITDVQFLQYPADRRTSQFINSQAMPYLQSETIKAQSASVDTITGATLTSEAFVRSLQAALNTAKN